MTIDDANSASSTSSLARPTSVNATRERALHIVRSELGGLVFGVDAHKVDRIEDADAPEVVDVHKALDLAELYALPTPPKDAKRRAVVVKVGDTQLRLKVGELARIVTLSPASLHEVPPFLEGLAARTGIDSIFVTDDGLGFVVDVEALDAAGAR